MTTKESLHELVEGLTDAEAAELWADLTGETDVRLVDGVVDARRYPVLAAIWDNDDDAVFDDD